MTLPATTYDLVLLLDPQVEQDARTKILSDVRAAIAAQGELVRHDEWGSRAMVYPIKHKTAAEYHLMQFHASTPELISGLNRSLHITDGIVRYRINKLKPGTPAPPDLRAERPSAPEAAAAERPSTHEAAPAEQPAPAAEAPAPETPPLGDQAE